MSRIKGSNYEFAQCWGTHRERLRKQKASTQKFFETRDERIADSTHGALDEFERQLESYTGPQKHDTDSSEDEAVPISGDQEFDEGPRKGASRVRSAPSGSRPSLNTQLRESQLRPREILRPSSPLTWYDYGNISIKPNSLLAQTINLVGASNVARSSQSRPSSSPGFYSGGPAVKAGYGFSMLEPILMPKEIGFKAPPLRFTMTCDIRPPSSQTRVASQQVITPKGVRMTAGHAKRCRRSHATLQQQVANEKTEEMQFQNGVFRGCWRDPTLDGPLPEDPPPDGLEWLADPPQKQTLVRRKATRILLGLDRLLAESRKRVTDLFAAFDKDASGTLEPHEFIEGLIKLKVLAHDEISEGEILQVLKVIDANFDGHVSLMELVKVLDTVKNLRQTAARKKQKRTMMKTLEKESKQQRDQTQARKVISFTPKFTETF